MPPSRLRSRSDGMKVSGSLNSSADNLIVAKFSLNSHFCKWKNNNVIKFFKKVSGPQSCVIAVKICLFLDMLKM